MMMDLRYLLLMLLGSSSSSSFYNILHVVLLFR